MTTSVEIDKLNQERGFELTMIYDSAYELVDLSTGLRGIILLPGASMSALVSEGQHFGNLEENFVRENQLIVYTSFAPLPDEDGSGIRYNNLNAQICGGLLRYHKPGVLDPETGMPYPGLLDPETGMPYQVVFDPVTEKSYSGILDPKQFGNSLKLHMTDKGTSFLANPLLAAELLKMRESEHPQPHTDVIFLTNITELEGYQFMALPLMLDYARANSLVMDVLRGNTIFQEGISINTGVIMPSGKAGDIARGILHLASGALGNLRVNAFIAGNPNTAADIQKLLTI